VPPVFTLLKNTGDIPERDMFNTFNMGVGMCAIVNGNDAERAVDILRQNGENAYIMGELKEGEGVEIC
jgi:phosphoribosylformylglycinamidine cyclo-ligase